jgi:hypothetical protein
MKTEIQKYFGWLALNRAFLVLIGLLVFIVGVFGLTSYFLFALIAVCGVGYYFCLIASSAQAFKIWNGEK